MLKTLPLALLLLGFSAQASINLYEKDGWRFTASGFVEMDIFADTTRSFTELEGNAPVQRPTVTAGMTGRMQYSVRNSRLAFEVEAPPVGAWATRSYFEFDFLGFNPDAGTAGATENSFMTSPTFRARHLYIEATSQAGWRLLAGQYWSLMGWQSNYYTTHADVAPLAGMLSSRNAQVRVEKSCDHGETTRMQVAVALARPPQRDAQLPTLDTGVRLAWGTRKSGFTLGTAGARVLQPLSMALSSTLREFVLPRIGGQVGQVSYFPGMALAYNVFLPIFAADADSTSAGSTFSLLGEATIGRGYGDQFANWTGNLSANPAGANMDSGLGGQDSQGNFRLLEMRSFNVHFQYHLPEETRTWINGGYGQLYSSNASLFVGGNALIVYPRQDAYFINMFRDLTAQIRTGIEYVFATTSYADRVIGHNHRIQLSAWFVF